MEVLNFVKDTFLIAHYSDDRILKPAAQRQNLQEDLSLTYRYGARYRETLRQGIRENTVLNSDCVVKEPNRAVLERYFIAYGLWFLFKMKMKREKDTRTLQHASTQKTQISIGSLIRARGYNKP